MRLAHENLTPCPALSSSGYDAVTTERDLYGGQGITVEDWTRTNALTHDRGVGLLAEGATVVGDDT